MSLLRESPRTAFATPPGAFAASPPERRGLRRDEVRLLVVRADAVTHTRFTALADHLRPGDAVVVNRSATAARAWDAHSAKHAWVVLHAANRVPPAGAGPGQPDDGMGDWVVEVRSGPDAARPVLDAEAGERFTVDGLAATLLEQYPAVGSS